MCTDSREDLGWMARKEVHAEAVGPDFGQAVAAEHLGREILDVVCNDDGGFGGDRRGNNVGILPLPCRLAQPLDGQNQGWCRANIGDREGLFHFLSPIVDLSYRDAHAGVEVSFPFRVDIVGPNWFECVRLGKVQK